ncbi:hypothetical protein HNR02_005945 [Amycolatopsis endophytica]|uniref:Uncharacterized protein n=1 Tax=Amycolatopsis endophytica TaxID=860233 RepID=A0A853BC23_9PSEU|nr:hypothetical protein [Amycolatopsis endophytica]NYI92570.1 hypothetical protein [Amycolatopsis endophytica]
MSDRTPIFDDVVAAIGLDWAELQGGEEAQAAEVVSTAEEALS